MNNFSVGDYVSIDIDGKPHFLIIDKIIEGKLYCKDDSKNTFYILPPEEVDKIERVILNDREIEDLIYGETSLIELCEYLSELPDYGIFDFNSNRKIRLTDLRNILEKYNNSYTENLFSDWLAENTDFFAEFLLPEDISDKEIIRFLPTEKEYILRIFDQIYLECEARRTFDYQSIMDNVDKYLHNDCNIDDLEYADMWTYIDNIDKKHLFISITDNEKELFYRLVDKLIEDGDSNAIQLKAYACYGGNALYSCDYKTSEDLLLRIFPEDISGRIANTLGYINYYGRTSDEPNYPAAFYFFSVGAAAGVTESIYKLADMFKNGYGVPQNEAIAYNLLYDTYKKTRKEFLAGEINNNFADVAIRMGDMFNTDEMPLSEIIEAYAYYLQARTALKIRNRRFGDHGVFTRLYQTISELEQNKLSLIIRPIEENFVQSLQYINTQLLDTQTVYDVTISPIKENESVSLKKSFGESTFSPKYKMVIKSSLNNRIFLTFPAFQVSGFFDQLVLYLREYTILDNTLVKHNEDGSISFNYNVTEKDFEFVSDMFIFQKKIISLKDPYILLKKDYVTGKEYRMASIKKYVDNMEWDNDSFSLYHVTDEEINTGDIVVCGVAPFEEEALVNEVQILKDYELLHPISAYPSVIRKK